MRAHLFSIGSELTQGHLTDTNAPYLAQELMALGIDLIMVKQVGDDLSVLQREFSESLDDADLIVATGGIGPTGDDLTREAIAGALGETPQVDPVLLETVRSFFTARGLEMPERNAKQAWLIPSAIALDNPVGTAPGWLAQKKNKMIIAMPGVPREMTRMWREQAVPRIAEKMSERVFRGTTLKTIGIGESALEDLLADVVVKANPIIATYAKDDGVHVRVTGHGQTEAEAEEKLALGIDQVNARAGQLVYGRDLDTLSGVILRMLQDRNLKLAIEDHAAGGRFWSLLAAEDLAVDQVIASFADLDRTSGALGAARSARLASRAAIGMGVVMHELDEGMGEVCVAVAGNDDDLERTFSMRASWPELQRRSALFSAEVLRQWLVDHP